MNGQKYIMALDAGTTSNRCIICDHDGHTVSSAQKEFRQFYPQPGWVEHDPEEIWLTQLEVAQAALRQAGLAPEQIAAIGITNQRETTVVWNRHTGKPVYPAIVWQCRRTAAYCDWLKSQGLAETIRAKTGLVVDPYFSATKIKWILDHVTGAREQAQNGELLFGTIETWLLWKLTGGKVHATDYSNASRTMLFNIHTCRWDPELLQIFGIPEAMLPKAVSNSEVLGYTTPGCFGKEIPIAGIAGDQQSALFGQRCFAAGEIKNTYGTGGFLLLNTGDQPAESRNGLITTIAWKLGDKVCYALEGSVFIAGAAIQWLRDELGLIRTAEESEQFARMVENTNGCYAVPAFTGLGAPYWDENARGVLVGLTRGVNKYHVVRAVLDSIAYQVNDMVKAMRADSGLEMEHLYVDGGASNNGYLMQTQADISNVRIIRPRNVESTAKGVAYLAGLAVGFWSDLKELRSMPMEQSIFTPALSDEQRAERIADWEKAVSRARGWEKPASERR